MLVHNVATLLKSPPGTTRDIIIDEPSPRLGLEIKPAGPVVGAARLYRTQSDIVAIGDASAQIEVECSRCLEPCVVPMHIHFEETFQPSVNIATGVPLPPSEDAALQIDEHHLLDLTEIVRQYMLADVPLSAVCRADCQGLCPECGADLNQGPCACGSLPATGPFAALAPLLSEQEQPPRRSAEA
jgi:uncharacterized protein